MSHQIQQLVWWLNPTKLSHRSLWQLHLFWFHRLRAISITTVEGAPTSLTVVQIMLPNTGGLSLLEQKRLQWAKEREEMIGLCGLWGSLDKQVNDKPTFFGQRRNSLLPPIQAKPEEQSKEEESETSGYLSDSPQHDYESSTDSQSIPWSAKPENYWEDRKAQKNNRNERRMRGTPDSVLSTPEDRLKWGDRGVGIGHLWEPVVELPDSRLPQVLEAYRATPRWLERGLKHADNNNKADILVIQHDDDERPPSNFILGQNAPLPPEVLEEREKRRRKALEHQNAIRLQLEERDKRRKQEKENRLREERIEEERIQQEREKERIRQEEERRRIMEKESIEKQKEEAMKEAIVEAERKAIKDKKKLKKREIEDRPKEIEDEKDFADEPPMTNQTEDQSDNNMASNDDSEKDISCQIDVADSSGMTRSVADCGSQSEGLHSLQFLNEGVALVLEGGPPGGLIMPQDALQLLLMSPPVPVQRPERVLTPSKLRCSRFLCDATTQTDRGKCCSILRTARSRRSTRQSGRTSGRSDSSDKSTSLERLTASHSHCSTSHKHRSRSQPRLSMGERPKWGINRPSVQYMKQSEKDPHYMRRIKRRTRRTKEVATSTLCTEEKLLESEFRLLAFQTDEEIEESKNELTNVLENGFRMVSNPSSPKFVPIIHREAFEKEAAEEDIKEESINTSEVGIADFEDDASKSIPDDERPPTPLESNKIIQMKGQENIIMGEESNVPEPAIIEETYIITPSEDSGIALKDDFSDLTEVKSNVDELDDDEDEDNNSVIIGPVMMAHKADTLTQISALKMGLKRLQNEIDSRCATPMSAISEI